MRLTQRTFHASTGTPIAEWYYDGTVMWHDDSKHLNSIDVAPFIVWLQAGPPKRYRITKTFDRKPSYVGFRDQFATDVAFVNSDDIEEI